MALKSGQLRRLKTYRTKPAPLNVLTVLGSPPLVGEIGVQYITDFDFTGGEPPYHPSLVGLGGASINDAGNVSGALTGSPGTRSPILTVYDETSPNALSAVVNWSVVVSAAPSGTPVNAQTIPWGSTTPANTGDMAPVANETITSAVILSGNGAGHWAVDSATGRFWPTVAGFSGAVLSCSFNGAAAVNITMALEAVAGRSVKNAAELTAAKSAQTNGTNIYLRPGNYGGPWTFTKLFATDSYITKHTGQTERPKFTTWVSLRNSTHLLVTYCEMQALVRTSLRIAIFDNAIDCGFTDNVIHGVDTDPNGTYTSTTEYTNPVGCTLDPGGGGSNLRVQRNTIYNVVQGINIGASANVTNLLEDNHIYWFVQDGIIGGGGSGAGRQLKIRRNCIHSPTGRSSEGPLFPHVDGIQLNHGAGAELDIPWPGVEISQNMYWDGDTRGGGHGMFYGTLDPPRQSLDSPIVVANFVAVNQTTGISLELVSGTGGLVAGNTVVTRNSGATANPWILVGVGTGGHVKIYGNIAGQIVASDAATTKIGNIQLGVYPGVAPNTYAAVFNGPTFTDLTTRAAFITAFTAKPGGPAAVAKAGAIGTGYSVFPTAVCDPAGASLADITGAFWE